MLATSQVLNAMRLTGQDSAGIRQALFYVRGHHADNNDYLARKILTLHGFGQNVDRFVNRLLAQGSRFYGWGVQKRFTSDPLDTALGLRATACANTEIQGISNGFDNLKTEPGFQVEAGCNSKTGTGFGWIRSDAVTSVSPSVYVSALVSKTLEGHLSEKEKDSFCGWILQCQNTDGTFGNGLVDTAGVLLWLDPTDNSANGAISYLVSQQLPNGSWGDDPYLTGLCLEALLSGENQK
jgi:hypothetical protein